MSNNYLNKMRSGRSSWIMPYTAFVKSYFKCGSQYIYCFYEGDDSMFYDHRVGHHYCKRESIGGLNKNQVLEVCTYIQAHTEYKKAFTLFFVDRDFDRSIYQDPIYKDVYETPCYSIENLYITQPVVKQIFRTFLRMNYRDGSLEKYLDIYGKRQREFHESIGEVNAYIAVQRELHPETKLNIGVKIKRYVEVTLNEVSKKYNSSELNDMFKEAKPIPDYKVCEKLSKLLCIGAEKSFRGKYEIDFLRKIIALISSQEDIKKRGKISSLSTRDILFQFSHFAETPNCLKKYIEDKVRCFKQIEANTEVATIDGQ